MIREACCTLIKNRAFTNLAMQATAVRKLHISALILHHKDLEEIVFVKILSILCCYPVNDIISYVINQSKVKHTQVVYPFIPFVVERLYVKT